MNSSGNNYNINKFEQELDATGKEGRFTVNNSKSPSNQETPTAPRPESRIDDSTNNIASDSDLKFLEPQSKYTPLEFDTPLDLYKFFSTIYQSGELKFYPWQEDVNNFLATTKPTWINPLRFLLRACNGSGKDAYVIAPFAVWFCCCKVRSRCIITSSSFSQLNSQTESYIRTLCFSINTWFEEQFGHDIFIIRKGHIICKATGSEIKMFATDDAGKAEGYHPWNDYPGAEMALIMNEAKTVIEEIFAAFRRCTGFNYWLEVSSPGQTSGHFYNTVKRSITWEEGYQRGKPFTKKVTAYDCPFHISKSEIEDAKEELGEHSPLFRSIYLAEFTSLDENVVIPIEIVQKCLDNPVLNPISIGTYCGIDTAAGGDEHSMYICKGNRIADEDHFREKDTTIAAARIVDNLNKWKAAYGLEPSHCSADDGGVSRGVIDQVVAKGWSVKRVLNQSQAINLKRYANRGAELWFRAREVLEHCYWRFDINKDRKLLDQLSTRYYKQSELNGKLGLESKREARAHGRPSPDRGDAFVLMLANLNVFDFKEKLLPDDKEAQVKPKKRFSNLDDLEEYVETEGIVDKEIPVQKRPVTTISQLFYGGPIY